MLLDDDLTVTVSAWVQQLGRTSHPGAHSRQWPCRLPESAATGDRNPGLYRRPVAAMKVYFWHGEHRSPAYAGGWVTATWAAAVSSLDELRSLCAQQQVKYPSKPFQAKPGRVEWEAATVRRGCLVFRNEEPTGVESGDWQVLSNDG